MDALKASQTCLSENGLGSLQIMAHAPVGNKDMRMKKIE